ncbi:hypothetical protein D9M69_591310 [compost metagenome]
MRAIRGWNAELFSQSIANQKRIVGGDQYIRIGRTLVARIDNLFVKLDRQIDRCLSESGIALGKDREQKRAEEEHTDRNGNNAIETEATFSGVATLDSDIAALGRCHGIPSSIES